MDFLEWISDKFSSLMDSFFNILPKSPIVYLTKNPEITRIIGYINWFFPVYLWISILETWLTCILVYYVVQIALRWLKAIE